MIADGYDSNYILHRPDNGLYEIVCIDNDRSFASDIEIENGIRSVGLRSVLFCMNQMKRPFDPSFREEVLELSEIEVRNLIEMLLQFVIVFCCFV